MSNEKVRIGIIGVGGWAKYGHLPALETLDRVEVVAVSSRSLAKAEQLAAERQFADPALPDGPADLPCAEAKLLKVGRRKSNP